MSTTTTLQWDQMRPGDDLTSMAYVITPEIHEDFLHGITTVPGTAALLVGDQGEPVAHPMQTLTDYANLIAGTYAPMGSGLHTRHETTSLRPIPLGTPLRATGRVAETYQRRGRDYWVADYWVSDDEGVLVQHRMTATIDRPETPAPEARPADSPPHSASGGNGSDQNGSGRQKDRDEEESWVEVVSRTFTLPLQVDYDRQYWFRLGEAFRNAPNTHTSVEFARSVGLPDAVAHSSHYYSWFADAALQGFGSDWMRGGSVDARFLSPVFPGDTVHIEKSPAEEGIGLRAIQSDGRLVAVGGARPPAS